MPESPDLKNEWPVPPPPAGIVDRVMARVAEAPAPVVAQEAIVPQRSRVRGALMLMAAGAIGAAAATGVLVTIQGREHAPAPPQTTEVTPPVTPKLPRDSMQIGGDGILRPAPTHHALDPIATPRKLPDEAARAKLLQEIGAARARREAAATTGGGGGGSGLPPIAVDPQQIQASVREVVPMLVECYEMAPPKVQKAGGHIVTEMTVTTEPGVGTLVEDLTFLEGASVLLDDADFTECVRETLFSVEMPPVDGGGVVVIHYPITFSSDEAEDDDDDDDEPVARKEPARKKKQVDPEPERQPEAQPEPQAATRTASELLDEAKTAAKSGQYARALRLSEEGLRSDATSQDLRMVAAIASCNLKSEAKARAHIEKLSAARQGMALEICKRNGIRL